MKNRIVRTILLLLAVAAAGGAGFVVVTLEQRAAAARAGELSVRDQVAGALDLVAEARAGQRGYVATGQGHPYWTARVTSLLPDLNLRMRPLRDAVSAGAAASAVDAAAVAIENFVKLDAQAQDYVSLDDPFLASDLIFSDGLEMSTAATTHLQEALRQEIAERDLALRRLRQRQAWAAAAGGAALLLAALLFFPVPVAKAHEGVGVVELDEAVEGARLAPEAVADHDLNLSIDAVTNGAAVAGLGAASPPDLQGAARLCTELARVLETSELPPLLARAADLLDAAGLVVWITDRGGRELQPVLCHGYARGAVAQMGSIPRDAQNATALTFRTAEARVVTARGQTNGAFVAPLMTPSGCVGVFAAELRNGSEQHESTRALAMILAAQVATLVGAAPQTGAGQQAVQG